MKELTVGDRVVITESAQPATVDQIGNIGLWLRIPADNDDRTPFFRWSDHKKIRKAVDEC